MRPQGLPCWCQLANTEVPRDPETTGLSSRNLTAEESVFAIVDEDSFERGNHARATADHSSARLAMIVVSALPTMLFCGGWVIIFILLCSRFAAGSLPEPAMLNARTDGRRGG